MKKYTSEYLVSEKPSESENIQVLNFLKSMAGCLKKRDVLEIGYRNSGLVPLLLAEDISHYHGIEVSGTPMQTSNNPVNDSKVTVEHKNVTNIDENKAFDIILMNGVIEHIPVYDMEIVWGKLKKILRPGGIIIIRTPIYDNPNMLDVNEKRPETMGILSNKQTMGTLLRTCLQHQFIMARSEGELFGLIRQDEMTKFERTIEESFLHHHQQQLAKYGLQIKDSYTKGELRKLVPGAGRLLVGCVAENTPKYRDQALRLVQSIRWFGGNSAGVNIFVCMVDDADQNFVNELESWGVFVRIVKRFSTLHPPSNKLRLFELEEVPYYDTIMLLDCDTLCVRDPYPFITGDHFQACMAAAATIPQNIFRRLFAHYKLQMPPQKYRTTFSLQPTIWYCNAGVLIFPQDILQSFYPVWKHYTVDLSQKKQLLGNRYFFCEQASLSLAYAAHPVPFNKLPVILNWHLPAAHSSNTPKIDPVIIHYHNWGTDKSGYIRQTSNPYANQRIRTFNQFYKRYFSNKEAFF